MAFEHFVYSLLQTIEFCVFRLKIFVWIEHHPFLQNHLFFDNIFNALCIVSCRVISIKEYPDFGTC